MLQSSSCHRRGTDARYSESLSSSGLEFDSAPIATYMKTAVEFIETNPTKEKRTIYFRRRPIHGLVSQPSLRRFVQGETTGHWAIEVGGYIWELENQKGLINYHVGVWINPGDADGRRLVATEREKIGDTILSDYEIKEAGRRRRQHASRRPAENPTSTQRTK